MINVRVQPLLSSSVFSSWRSCRFSRKFGGDLGIGNYAATVSRLKIMWTATCGVVEILGMVRKRKELLEVSRNSSCIDVIDKGCSQSNKKAVQHPRGPVLGSDALARVSRRRSTPHGCLTCFDATKLSTSTLAPRHLPPFLHSDRSKGQRPRQTAPRIPHK